MSDLSPEGLIKKLEIALIKSKISHLIYDVEIEAPAMGITSKLLLNKYAKKHKKEKNIASILFDIERKLKKNIRKDEVYKPFLDRDIYLLLKESITRQIDIDKIFADYAPIKEKGEKLKRSIKAKLYFPFVLFVLIVLGLNETMSNFTKISSMGMTKFGTTDTFIMDNFIMLNFSYGLVFAIALLIYPQYMPLIKGVFLKLKGMLGLSTVRTMTEMGYSAGEIIKTLIKQFEIKNTALIKKDLNGLLELMEREKFTDITQSARLSIAAERNEISKAVLRTLKQKSEEIDNIGNTVNSIMGTMSLVLSVPPTIMALSIFIKLMGSATASAL